MLQLVVQSSRTQTLQHIPSKLIWIYTCLDYAKLTRMTCTEKANKCKENKGQNVYTTGAQRYKNRPSLIMKYYCFYINIMLNTVCCLEYILGIWTQSCQHVMWKRNPLSWASYCRPTAALSNRSNRTVSPPPNHI
jgi:hypothetical protein